jgi:lipoprotein NlpI
MLLLVCFAMAIADDYARGVERLQQRDNKGALQAFDAALKANPKLALAHDRRGDALLKLGQFKEAVAAFDVYLEANPEQSPQHWRRGIALYYAGRHADGVKQFEIHKTVNAEDVENAAWHYLCNIKVVGKMKARAALITVTSDARKPMAEIQKLFAGQLTPEDVLAVADKTDAKTEDGIAARFYAHLYIGLWHESEGNTKLAYQHLSAAVTKYKISHYMWDVANAHRPLAEAALKK